jgi:hypothetical protein
MSAREEANRTRKQLRVLGYDDGFNGRARNRKHLGEPEYLRSYRQGVKRRLEIESGAVSPDA